MHPGGVACCIGAVTEEGVVDFGGEEGAVDCDGTGAGELEAHAKNIINETSTSKILAFNKHLLSILISLTNRQSNIRWQSF